MPSFEERATCHAPAEEVWKLLYDTARFPEWWAGMSRVEGDCGDEITRYMSEWPDFPYPTRVTRRDDGGIVVSCLLSDIVHEWALEPAAAGCAVRVRVEIPDGEAARLASQEAEIRASLARLVARAEELAR
jgi:Polyketide cyclase / dehydrase and lipid transport